MRRGLAWVVGGVGGALALWMLSVGAGDGSTAPSSPPTEDRLEEVVERWRAHPSVEDAWLRLGGGEGGGGKLEAGGGLRYPRLVRSEPGPALIDAIFSRP